MAEPVDVEAVTAANHAYYDAFERRDLDAMSDIWHHDDAVVCTHPGWKTLHGWGAVAGSWFALFGGPQQLQFILTDERVHLDGEVAWVTVDENLISEQLGATVAAVNVFRRIGGRWLMVLHHGSPVAPDAPGQVP
jgi:ketosteroid isomerase-like protein